MIKTIEQAQKIQKSRVKAGKRGYAKAARRFLKREYPNSYKIRKSALDVAWPAKAKAQEAA